MAIVQTRKEHCGLAEGRVMYMTDVAAEKLVARGKVKILKTNESNKARLMAENSVHIKPDEPETEQEPQTPTAGDFDSMKKAKDKPTRDKAVKSEETKRKGPTNVTTSEG